MPSVWIELAIVAATRHSSSYFSLLFGAHSIYRICRANQRYALSPLANASLNDCTSYNWIRIVAASARYLPPHVAQEIGAGYLELKLNLSNHLNLETQLTSVLASQIGNERWKLATNATMERWS